MGGVTYDTGALVAAERNNRQMWALHAGYLAEEVIPRGSCPRSGGGVARRFPAGQPEPSAPHV
jgi:hypothetical protein